MNSVYCQGQKLSYQQKYLIKGRKGHKVKKRLAPPKGLSQGILEAVALTVLKL